MKNKYWILIFGAVLALCLILSILSFFASPATQALIKSDARIITVDLSEDQSFTLKTEDGGYNVVTVKGRKIAVTEANCPDQYCVKQGFSNSGVQIVCLPHKLVITFLGETEIDGALG